MLLTPNAFKELTVTAKKPQIVSYGLCFVELIGVMNSCRTVFARPVVALDCPGH